MCAVCGFFFGFFKCFFFLLQGEHITTTIITTKYRYRKFDKRFFWYFCSVLNIGVFVVFFVGIFYWAQAQVHVGRLRASGRRKRIYCVFLFYIYRAHCIYRVIGFGLKKTK